jgi:hypothetical protein
LDNSEFASIKDEFRGMDRVQLEQIVTGSPVGIMPDQVSKIVHAKAELVRRGSEAVKKQEISRRNFETDHQAARQQFEEKLAQRQMDHASSLAREQLDTAQSAARAARMAAWAAAAAAVGAIAQAIIAILKG